MSHLQSYPCPPGPYGSGALPFHAGCGCRACRCGTMIVGPYELSVGPDGTTAQAFVGGAVPVHLSLEYVVDEGASSPSIKVTSVSGASTSTWEETAPETGYHVKTDFMSLQPGAKVTLDATAAAARLRWCETFCC